MNIDHRAYLLQARAGEHYDTVWDSPRAVGRLFFTSEISDLCWDKMNGGAGLIYNPFYVTCRKI